MMFLYSLYVLYDMNIQKLGVKEILFLLTGVLIDLILLPLELLMLIVIWLYCKVKKYYK